MKLCRRASFILLALALPCAAQTIPVHSDIGYAGGNSTNRVVITWEAIPTKLYNVLTTTALGQQWQTLNPSVIYASNNLVRVRDTNNLPVRFYKVVKLDIDPPEIWHLNPGSNATAVARQGSLKVYLRDETAIDPASIVLTVGTNPAATLADARLAYTNGTITYTPATNQFLGTNGQTVTATLAFSDTLGHRATNTWPFKLELTPILAGNVVLITNSSPLTLLSTNGDTFVFSYAGAASGLTNGHILVSTDSNFPYKRRVLSVADNPGAHAVSLATTQAALADILLQGSVRFVGEEFVPDSAGFAKASAGAGTTINLGGKTLYNANNVTIQTVSGRLFLDPSFSISAELRNPRTFDLDVSASSAFDLTLQASWQNTATFFSEQRIGQALRQSRLLGFIPTPTPIPISAAAGWEVYVGAEGEVTAQASLTAGFESKADLVFGARLRDGQWKPYGRENIVILHPLPVAWQGGGSGRIRGYVEARLTVYLEGHVQEAIANVRPYLEATGNTCVPPGQIGVDVTLYRGINGTLALDLHSWDSSWAALPSWGVFNSRSIDPLWRNALTTPTGQPPQIFGSMSWIPCGGFNMGSPPSEGGRFPNEGPQTLVTISHGFWMARYEVNQSEYLIVMGSNPSRYTGDLNRPVENVSWNDAVAYCTALTTRERNAGRLPVGFVYRLPTEAEWEYACRAGTTTPFHYGDELRSGMANFAGISEYLVDDPYHANPFGTYLVQTTSGGSYAPNAWGLYDMHGNVGEWCSDWWSSSLPGGSVSDPQGSLTGSFRSFRGGSWVDNAFLCRSAIRSGFNVYPTHHDSGIGFRVVLAPNQP